MNRAELPLSHSPLRSDSSPWDEVRRNYRRAAVLRAQGRYDEADEIAHGELARALAVARLSAPDALDEASIFAAEDDRVASAAVLAELLVPLLVRHLQPRAVAAPAVESTLSTPAAPAAPIAAAERDAPVGVPPLADLIDGMLAQERAGPRGRR